MAGRRRVDQDHPVACFPEDAVREVGDLRSDVCQDIRQAIRIGVGTPCQDGGIEDAVEGRLGQRGHLGSSSRAVGGIKKIACPEMGLRRL